MAIKKVDVQTFISNQITKRRNEIEPKAKEIIRAAVEPIVMAMYADRAQAEREAERLLTSLAAFSEDSYDIRNLSRSLNSYVINYRSHKVNDHARHMFTNLFHSCTNGFPNDLRIIELELKESLAKEIEQFKAVDKLGDELITLINSCRNGDSAYKQLVELGIDMSEMNVNNPNLPAIIKLSVDPCVINGNCQTA